ncbi:MAG: hypothetical protein NWF09_08995 [Candidatus Bathyarchaeota archaeon]|nr:hypothetical protein [Candidatus Bathyarchaeota archaeon]
MNKTQKIGLAFALSLIAIGVLTMLATAIYEVDITYANYGGAIIQSDDELTIITHQIARAGSAIPVAGGSPGTAVVLSDTMPLASNGVAKGAWYYRVSIFSIAETTPPNQVYKVDLYRWNSNTLDYTLIGSVYVKSAASPDDNDGARIYFNLGALPNKSEALLVVVSRV